MLIIALAVICFLVCCLIWFHKDKQMRKALSEQSKQRLADSAQAGKINNLFQENMWLALEENCNYFQYVNGKITKEQLDGRLLVTKAGYERLEQLIQKINA